MFHCVPGEGTSCGLVHIHQFLLTSPTLILKEVSGRSESFSLNGIILITLLRHLLCSLNCPDLFSHFSHKSYSLIFVIFAAPFWTPPSKFTFFKQMLQTASLYGQARDLKSIANTCLVFFLSTFLKFLASESNLEPLLSGQNQDHFSYTDSVSLGVAFLALQCSHQGFNKKGRGLQYVIFKQASHLL